MSIESPETETPAWKPLGTTERRVLGVLVEKAKTTPDAYPLTINSITTGCNQKSNRSPQMNLDPVDVENALENLRRLGAVTEILGSGRTNKYRHRIYEWMGVDKVEAAVMAELILRGEQTIGELRGRASRMEKIADVAALRPVLDSLMQKGLVQALTPPGRGQVVTHCLYLPQQQEKLERQYGQGGHSIGDDPGPSIPAATNDSSPNTRSADPGEKSVESPNATAGSAQLEQLRFEMDSLRDIVTSLEKRLETLEQLIN